MTSRSTLSDVSLKAIAEEELLLVTPSDISQPTWHQLLALGFIDHPDGAYHASQLLSVNFSEFQNSNQFNRSGFSNQINLILEPVGMGLGFTVLPRHAVSAFKESDKVKVHQLAHQMSETLYLGIHSNTFTPNRVNTVIAEAENCLKNI